jgi:hypothetical protein
MCIEQLGRFRSWGKNLEQYKIYGDIAVNLIKVNLNHHQRELFVDYNSVFDLLRAIKIYYIGDERIQVCKLFEELTDLIKSKNESLNDLIIVISNTYRKFNWRKKIQN